MPTYAVTYNYTASPEHLAEVLQLLLQRCRLVLEGLDHLRDEPDLSVHSRLRNDEAAVDVAGGVFGAGELSELVYGPLQAAGHKNQTHQRSNVIAAAARSG